jgi:hypothetical protein
MMCSTLCGLECKHRPTPSAEFLSRCHRLSSAGLAKRVSEPPCVCRGICVLLPSTPTIKDRPRPPPTQFGSTLLDNGRLGKLRTLDSIHFGLCELLSISLSRVSQLRPTLAGFLCSRPCKRQSPSLDGRWSLHTLPTLFRWGQQARVRDPVIILAFNAFSFFTVLRSLLFSPRLSSHSWHLYLPCQRCEFADRVSTFNFIQSPTHIRAR